MATAYQPAPLDTLLAAIPALPRPVLAHLAGRIIDRLDMLDGDGDLEPNGDEQDGQPSEDEFQDYSGLCGAGPGCPIADPDLDGGGL